MDEDTLYEQSAQRLEKVISMGTAAIEIKSGYGLTAESEIKMLRVIRRLKENYPIGIKSTFWEHMQYPLPINPTVKLISIILFRICCQS